MLDYDKIYNTYGLIYATFLGDTLYEKPPDVADSQAPTLWKLNTTIYGLSMDSMDSRTYRISCHSI